jgi:hypothetical protein
MREDILRGLSCHPDEASNASGRKDLGQLRASEAGSGFESLHPLRMADAYATTTDDNGEGPLRDFRTGTGFACAKLSEVLPPLALLGSSG